MMTAGRFAPRRRRCGWIRRGPGCWQHKQEIILRRATGVWYWYPDGLDGKRAFGPFMSMRAARLRAIHGAGAYL